MGLDERDAVHLVECLEVLHSPLEKPGITRGMNPQEIAHGIAMRVHMEALADPKTKAKLQTHQYRGHRGLTQWIDEETHAAMELKGHAWRPELFAFDCEDPAAIYRETRKLIIGVIASLGAEYFSTCTPHRTMPRHGATVNLRRRIADLIPESRIIIAGTIEPSEQERSNAETALLPAA